MQVQTHTLSLHINTANIISWERENADSYKES